MKQILLAVVVLLSLIANPSSKAQRTSVNNLVALSRLVGYLQYFHPSDTAKDVDWQAVIIAYHASVENAQSPSELQDVLFPILIAYAPTATISIDGAFVQVDIPDINEATGVRQWVHTPLSQFDNPSLPIYEPIAFTQAIDEGIFARTATFQRSLGDDGIEIDIPIHDPRQAFILPLNDDLTLHLPLSVFVDETGSLPSVDADTIPSLPSSADYSLDDIGLRIAIISHTWNFVQHNFSYHEVLETRFDFNWETALYDGLQGALEAESTFEFYRALQAMTSTMNDGHGSIILPRDLSGEWIAQGLIAGQDYLPFTWSMIEDQLTITTTFDGSPLSEGDVVLTVNGISPSDYLAEERRYMSPTNGYDTFQLLINLLSARGQDTVELTVERYVSGDIETLSVAPSNRNLTRLSEFDEHEYRPQTFAQLGDDIYYMDATRMSEANYISAANTIEDDSEASGLVIDLRGYPVDGMPLRLLGSIAGRDLASAPFLIAVITQPNHDDIQFYQIDTSQWIQAGRFDLPDDVAFITNSQAISYSESILGIVEGYQLGHIVGESTAGANGNVAIETLGGGLRLIFTSLHVTKFDGSPLYTVGVIPTIPVERTREAVANRIDEYLLVAFEAVGGETLNPLP
ncbi:MAG: S41 family peptidase [Chloroflexota bacterium]